MVFNISCKNVANLLKLMVNERCEDGFLWYPEAKVAKVSLYEINTAIKVLEEQEDMQIEIADMG